jgi:hypothetical protein
LPRRPLMTDEIEACLRRIDDKLDALLALAT